MPLSIETEECTMSYDAADVLYVPELSDTLLSIEEIAKEGHKATFDKDGVKVELERGESFTVERRHSMYALKAKPRTVDEQALVSKTEAIDKASLWHYCLGYPGQNATRQLGFDVLGSKCKAYEMAKSH